METIFVNDKELSIPINSSGLVNFLKETNPSEKIEIHCEFDYDIIELAFDQYKIDKYDYNSLVDQVNEICAFFQVEQSYSCEQCLCTTRLGYCCTACEAIFCEKCGEIFTYLDEHDKEIYTSYACSLACLAENTIGVSDFYLETFQPFYKCNKYITVINGVDDTSMLMRYDHGQLKLLYSWYDG